MKGISLRQAGLGEMAPCTPVGASGSDSLRTAVDLKERIESAVIHVSEVLYYLDLDRFLNKKQAAAFSGLCERTLDGAKDLPRYKPAGKVLFRKSELVEWMTRHRERSLDEIDSLVSEVLEGAGKKQKRVENNYQSIGQIEDK
jgi:hypothetical protein